MDLKVSRRSEVRERHQKALSRLRFICQLADTSNELPMSALNSLVTEAVDVVVHCVPSCHMASTPTSASAAVHAAPSQWKATPTSADHRSSPVGTKTSTHAISPGPTSTAPPPPRRRTTSTPAAAARPASTTSSGYVLPSTTAGAVTVATRTTRPSGKGCASTSSARPRGHSTRHGIASGSEGGA